MGPAGARGYCSTWGDQKSWQLVVNEMSSALAWAWAKKRLAFCELVLDGDTEGVFRLRRLPSIEQAAEIRDILGLRKRVEWTPEELARRQEVGRRPHKASAVTSGTRAAMSPISLACVSGSIRSPSCASR